MNGFCPLGPCVTTTDEIGDPHNLKLKCIVNGVTKQDSTTQQLVFDTNKLVSWCSQFCTLLPGDVILTGTPPGVGVFMKPPQFLKVLYNFLSFFTLSASFHSIYNFSFSERGRGGMLH